MAYLRGSEREEYVRAMFARIAHRYDLMNRLMTGGQDLRWRREVIRRASLPPEGLLLDLGAGTGDLSREAVRQYPRCLPVAADFTLEMMRVGQIRSPHLCWIGADALHLPFPSSTFDAVVSAFLFRNLSDLPRALGEQWRVLKPGGKIVILDTTRPTRTLFTPLISFHLYVLIPWMGNLLTGAREAYRYLPDSTVNFLPAEQLAEMMTATGFSQVSFRRLMFATIAIHWGMK